MLSGDTVAGGALAARGRSRPMGPESPGFLCVSESLANLICASQAVSVFATACYGIRLSALPTWPALVRRLTFNLSKRRLEWVFTVFSLTNNASAISRLL